MKILREMRRCMVDEVKCIVRTTNGRWSIECEGRLRLSLLTFVVIINWLEHSFYRLIGGLFIHSMSAKCVSLF